MEARETAPCEQGSRKIQLPYLNSFDTIWEYEKSFFSGQINFFSYLGPTCPICHKPNCYRAITPYFRNAIDLLPKVKKDRVPIARFLCTNRKRTFSLLPIQLIPYVQYTVAAVIGTLLLGYGCYQRGERGFWGAVLAVDEVDPDSLLCPYLIICWLNLVTHGLRRAHEVLGRFYDLSDVRTSPSTRAWDEVGSYFFAFHWNQEIRWGPLLHRLLYRYSHNTMYFVFGIPSQHRTSISRSILTPWEVRQ